MNEIKTSCASTDQQITIWESVDWNKCEAKVKKLQTRIVKAQKDSRHNKVKALQWILIHSNSEFYIFSIIVEHEFCDHTVVHHFSLNVILFRIYWYLFS